ncbi:MAG: penicillin-binding protein [Firmicutes bacterium]|nr:penicillin-binding protein [Bacillota bacterium]
MDLKGTVNDVVNLVSKRAAVLLFFSLLFVVGLLAFVARYFNNASLWVQHPANKHLYENGKLLSQGTIYDRRGSILAQINDGSITFNEDQMVRTALMHTTGDIENNVGTGALVAFGDRLSGWNIIDGVYRFNKSPAPGDDLVLTLDADLCTMAYRELSPYKGAVGVYNYKTGEILCMASTPSFDPQNPPAVEAGPEKYEGIYINNFLSARYTPGSIFKLVTTAAALDSLDNVENRTYPCAGELQVGGDRVTCMASHGEVTLEQALAHSCNCAFARITLDLGAEKLQEYADLAGFNSGLEIDGIKTVAGRVDLAEAEGVDLAWAGIGQYTNTANPLNFMAFMGAIANDGVRVTPEIIRDEGLSSFIKTTQKKRILSPQTAKKLKQMMRNNTVSVYGEENFKGLELCAKSGTAQVGGGKKPHAWFAGFLDRRDFPLAFVVVIENGGSGGKIAAPVAATVLQQAVDSP